MLPMSAILCVLTPSKWSPSLLVSNSEASGIIPKMPMEPVRVVGSATILLAAQEM